MNRTRRTQLLNEQSTKATTEEYRLESAGRQYAPTPTTGRGRDFAESDDDLSSIVSTDARGTDISPPVENILDIDSIQNAEMHVAGGTGGSFPPAEQFFDGGHKAKMPLDAAAGGAGDILVEHAVIDDETVAQKDGEHALCPGQPQNFCSRDLHSECYDSPQNAVHTAPPPWCLGTRARASRP